MQFSGFCCVPFNGVTATGIRSSVEFWVLTEYSSTLKIQSSCSSETSLGFQRLHSLMSQKLELFTPQPG